ncbi:MAG: hypothetical protein WA052_02855 [Microgenomates group bacterium]
MFRKYALYFFPICLSLLISINFFWSESFLSGFDTPFYLSTIRDFARDVPSITNYFILDRYLVIGFPALLSRLFNLDPVASYRIAITVISAIISILISKLMFKLTKSRLAGIALASAVIISPYLLTYSYMLFANYTSFVILFAFFAIELGKEFRLKSVVLGVVLGLIFYIHNFSSVAYSLVVGLYFIFKLILEDNRLSTIKRATVILLISCVIGFFQIIKYFPVTLPPFLTVASSSSFVGSIINKIKIIAPSQPAVLGDEVQRIKATFLDETGKYWLVYFVCFSLFAFITKRKEIVLNLKKFAFPLALFIVGLVFSFQPLVGLNFLPERFIGLVIISTFFFYAIFLSLFSKSKVFKILAVLPLLFTYLSSDTKILNRGPVFVNDMEVSFYQKIAQIVPKENSYILLPSGNYYWAKYYLDGYTFMPGDYFIACGIVKIPDYQNSADVAYAKLLSEKSVEEAQLLLKATKNSIYMNITIKKLYIITNHSMNCSEGYVLDKLSGVKLILNKDNFYLYEVL